jgi:hypothetical protein
VVDLYFFTGYPGKLSGKYAGEKNGNGTKNEIRAKNEMGTKNEIRARKLRE